MLRPTLARIGGLALLALWAALPVQAAEEQAKPLAVIVGIDDYEDALIKPRQHAEADAQALYDLFTSKDHGNFEADRVRLLLGQDDAKRKAQPATRDNILAAVRWLAQKAKRDDPVVFFFIGTGAPLGERTVYFATDSTFKDRAKDAVAAADIETALEKLQSQKLCAFLDINFKAVELGKEVGDVNLTNLYKEFLGKEEENPTQSRVVFLWRGLSGSPDLDEHGLFAQVILAGLKGAADKEGYEADGAVTLDELHKYLSQEVPTLARQHVKSKDERDHMFYVLGGHTGPFRLSRNPEAAVPAEQRLARFEKLAKERTLAFALTEEGQRLLSRMPKLEAHQKLRKRYQALADSKLTLNQFKVDRYEILEGMKLSEPAARSFAGTVMNAIGQVTEVYIKEVDTADLVVWAIRGIYQAIDETLPQDLRQRLTSARNLSQRDLLELLKDARLKLGKREDLDKHHDIDLALQQMLHHLDPHTTYVDPETLSQFRRDIEKNYTGVGIQIRKDSETDMILVVTPIKGSPAYRAGIKAGDLITRIVRDTDGEGNPLELPEVISTKGLSLHDAVKKVLGKSETKVKLTIQREGLPRPLDLEITRAQIDLETVMGYRRTSDDGWSFWIDPESRIGYIRLASFANYTERDLRRALLQLTNNGLRGLVLDLRFNPGGLLRSAVAVSDLFIDDGEIVSIRPRVGQIETHRGKQFGSYLNFPLVCLVNEGSASASEIVSACLQDHKRAVIMGERSFGKGSVQNIQGFDGGQLKVTIATFWRPSGQNLNKASTKGKDEDTWGVVPDEGFRVKLSRKERDDLYEHLHEAEVIGRLENKPKPVNPDFKDRQLQTAVDYLRKQIRTAAQDPVKKAG